MQVIYNLLCVFILEFNTEKGNDGRGAQQLQLALQAFLQAAATKIAKVISKLSTRRSNFCNH